jgi:hypothetical protein
MNKTCTKALDCAAIVSNIATHHNAATRTPSDYNEIVVKVDLSSKLRLGAIAWILKIALRSNEDFEKAHEEHKLTTTT